ncbi:MAG: hypothetical protein KA140_01460 [Caldisericia bacterium]|nr:hypothetical protein [Caldisericia bacterium]
MRKIALAILIFATTLASCGEPGLVKLDKTFSGSCFTISYPSTYKLTSNDDGVTISGNFNIIVKIQKQPGILKGLIAPILVNLQQNNKSTKITFVPAKIDDMEFIRMEGFDDYDRYTFAYFVPINDGVVIMELEPTFVNENLTKMAQEIAYSFKVTDYDFLKSR